MGKVSKILCLLIVLEVLVAANNCHLPPKAEMKMFHLDDSLRRYARLRCLGQFPQAEMVNFTNSYETQCFMHCFLYKMGLMDLKTRGLDSDKFIDIWENNEVDLEDDSCLDGFDFSEPLSGTCNDTYVKLMQFRDNCLELFEYTFAINNTQKTEYPHKGKKVGQSASEFCSRLESENVGANENSQETDVSFKSLYQNELQCIFENIHYLDAYGRVDESEILLSFQEAREDSIELQAFVRRCVVRANSKYQTDSLGSTVIELDNCLRKLGSVYKKVFQRRDENSRQY